MAITAAVLLSTILEEVQNEILAEIEREEKPDFGNLMKKMVQQFNRIIGVVEASLRQQYLENMQLYIQKFVTVKTTILTQAEILSSDQEEFTSSQLKTFKELADKIDGGTEDGFTTKLHLELLGGHPYETSIPMQGTLPQKYREFLIQQKYMDRGIPLLEFSVSTFLFLCSCLEAVVALKYVYVRTKRLTGSNPRKLQMQQIDRIAKEVIERVFLNRGETLALYYNLYRNKNTLKCNIQKMEGGKALEGVEGRTNMHAGGATIRMSNALAPYPSLGGDIKFRQPVFVATPPDGNSDKLWHLSVHDNRNFILKNKGGRTCLGWFDYLFVYYDSSSEITHKYDIDRVLAIENFDIVQQRNIMGEALWDILLTVDDEVVLFRNIANKEEKVLDGASDRGADEVIRQDKQLYIGTSCIHNNFQKWKIIGSSYSG